MANLALTTGLQTVSTTGAITPTAGVDISGMTKAVTVCLECVQLTSAKNIAVQLEGTTNGFTATTAIYPFQFLGPIGGGRNLIHGRRLYGNDRPALCCRTAAASGIGGSVLRNGLRESAPQRRRD